MDFNKEKYNELAYYTLAHPDPAFIHQYIVDAYTAQNADRNTRLMTLAFALIGLYLHMEKGYTGKEIQNAHMQLAIYKRDWPTFPLPEGRGTITIADVLAVPAGVARDEMITKWSASVWEAYRPLHEKIKELVETELLSL